jgi:hypothetical protein
MKNYLAVFAADVFGASGYAAMGAQTLELCQAALDSYLSFDPTAVVINPPTEVFWLLNKNTLTQLFAGTATLLSPFSSINFTQDRTVAKSFGIESAVWAGTDTQDPKQVSAAKAAEKIITENRKASSKVKPTTIKNIWIIVRSGMYFAGFEVGTGDPVFVRFLLGTTSAHLYLTQTQADTDAARIRKFYKRPDIPVDVVQI